MEYRICKTDCHISMSFTLRAFYIFPENGLVNWYTARGQCSSTTGSSGIYLIWFASELRSFLEINDYFLRGYLWRHKLETEDLVMSVRVWGDCRQLVGTLRRHGEGLWGWDVWSSVSGCVWCLCLWLNVCDFIYLYFSLRLVCLHEREKKKQQPTNMLRERRREREDRERWGSELERMRREREERMR